MSHSHTSTSHEIGTLSVVVQNADNLNLPNQVRTEGRDLYCTLYFDSQYRSTESVKNGQWNHDTRFTLFEEFEEEKRVASSSSPSSQNGQGTGKVKGGLVILLSCWAENQGSPDFIGEASVDFTEALRTGKTDNRVTLTNLTGRSCGEVYIQLTFRSHEKAKFTFQPDQALNMPAPDYQSLDRPFPELKHQLYQLYDRPIPPVSDAPFSQVPATPQRSDPPPLPNISVTGRLQVDEKEADFSAPPVYETSTDRQLLYFKLEFQASVFNFMVIKVITISEWIGWVKNSRQIQASGPPTLVRLPRTTESWWMDGIRASTSS